MISTGSAATRRQLLLPIQYSAFQEKTMKIPFAISTLVITTFAATHVHASRSPVQQATLEGTTFAGLAIAGAVAAGPIGALVGALGGAFFAGQSREANHADLALQQADQERAQLQSTLSEQQARLQILEEEATAKLTFQILFASGSDTLSEIDMQRVHELAEHLERNPGLMVVLDGHADPRGTDEYNNVLSLERAKAVKDALEAMGITSERIRHQGHGNRFSIAPKGDEEAYRQERRVDITLETSTPVYAHF
jgi:outer membrane protein OmpA-like peptidoglycan-associated protein